MYTDRALREKNRCFKEKGRSQVDFFDFVSALFLSQITVGTQKNKHHKENEISLKRKRRATWTRAKLSLYHPERFTNRWQPVVLKRGADLSHFQGDGGELGTIWLKVPEPHV